ncbi:hypothetical protein [Enterococcus hermanniensis]|uniref:DUF4365 domain-containing protein n=1 Tax=Enterococcus hermanniensis TaxID=249189 RepID=A0A1L8TPM2_9ENTE|nr:hypothetical protein [Enterococcus hermanniensis]OJG46024.1 hypothetical protein RV04_GL001790 [Enterococcus hermanniensis]
MFLNQSRKIDASIASGDKGISFDGKAILFSNEENSKSSYLSSIPVQVKGTEVECFSRSVAKFYDFDKDTFKNFQYEDGVVIFLVEILKENLIKTKVFYCFLDAKELEMILNELGASGNNTRVIELEELSLEADLDETFSEIAIRRKVYGFKDAKLDSFLNRNSSIEIFQNDFDKSVVEDSKRSIQLFEYKNPDSQFNIDLKAKMMEVLSQAILFDTFRLAEIYGKIIRLELLELLPEENRNLALLIKARYLASNEDYKSAREALSQVKKISETIDKVYDSIFIEVNFDSYDLEKLFVKTTLSSDKQNKYKAKYYLKNRMISIFWELIGTHQTDSRDWQYLKGEYFLSIGNSEAASQIFSQLNEESFMIELKYKELFSDFSLIASGSFFNFQKLTEESNSKINLLIKEIEFLRRKIEKKELIEMPGLEDLYFEAKVFLNPEEGLKTINNLLANEEKNTTKKYLCEWKIRALYLSTNYDEALNYLDQLSSDFENTNMIMFRILLLTRKSFYKDVLDYISGFFSSNESLGNERLFGFMTHMYLSNVRNYQNIKEEDFDNVIQDLVSKYQLDLPLLLDLENTRKKKGYKNYGNSFESIKIQFCKYPDERKMDDIAAFLLQNNELELAQKLYFDMCKVNKQIGDEIITALYLFNGKTKECLDVLGNYSDTELSDKMLAYKSEAYNRSNQYRATLKLYKNRRGHFDDFLGQVLIAKIEMNDKTDIEAIIDRGMKSVNTIFEINSAFAQIKFGINVKRGFQTIEKFVLKDRFNNSELNLSIIQSALIEIKEKTTLDTYFDVDLSWFKFKTKEGFRELVLVPSEWNISNFDNLEFQGTNSDFKLLMQGISIGDYVEFEDESIMLIEVKPLSTFIVQKVMNRESGDIGSGKPLTSFSLNLEGGSILDEFTNVLKGFDRTEQHNEIKNLYHQFHAPFIYSQIVSETDMFEFYLQIFNDKSSIYYVGDELSYDSEVDYQISISSIVFLASLNLLYIIKEHQNIFIEETQKKWIENVFSNNLSSKVFGRVGLLNNEELFLNEKNDEQRKQLSNIYRNVALTTRKLNFDDIGEIDSRINHIFLFDESSIQAAVDYGRILLSEDEAIQIIGNDEFSIKVSSIGMLVSQHFLDIEKNASKFLDIHIQAIDQKSAWRLQRSTLNKITDLVENSADMTLVRKFNNWGISYVNYFSSENS